MQDKSLRTHPQGCGELCLCIIHAVDWDTVETLRKAFKTKYHLVIWHPTHRGVAVISFSQWHPPRQKLCRFYLRGGCGAVQRGLWTAWGTAGTAGTPARSEGRGRRVRVWGEGTGIYQINWCVNGHSMALCCTSCKAVALWPVTSRHIIICSSRMTWKVERMGLQSNTENKKMLTIYQKCPSCLAGNVHFLENMKKPTHFLVSLVAWEPCPCISGLSPSSLLAWSA